MEKSSAMPYRQLGKSNLFISQLGFGCMSLNPGQSDFKTLIDTAIDKGINYFDTADIYNDGQNETAIGAALKQKRKQVIIATKVGNQIKPDGSGLNWNPSKKHILAAVENSLTRLQTDYIDLYQLHGGTIEDNISETIEAFETLQQQGKIRYYGISSIRPNVIKAYVEQSNIVSVMMQYSLLDRRAEETCFNLLQQNNIGVVARGTVAGGLLAGKATKQYLNFGEKQVELATEAVKMVTGKNGSPAATAIAFALAQPVIKSSVVGIRTMQQLNDSLLAINNSLLSNENLLYLKNINPINLYDQHR